MCVFSTIKCVSVRVCVDSYQLAVHKQADSEAEGKK